MTSELRQQGVPLPATDVESNKTTPPESKQFLWELELLVG